MEVDRSQLLTDLKWSLTFTSNVQPLFEIKGYWDQVQSFRFLVHCWSLGVEIQFYVIAPFIVGYCRQQKWNYLVYILLLFSLTFQLITEHKISYGILPSRIWQFLCGTLAYEIELSTSTPMEYQKLPDDEANYPKESIQIKSRQMDNGSMKITIIRELLVIFLIVIVLANPKFIGETGIRILGTLLTTFFISSSNAATFSFVSSKLLVYIGDISYTLYLVHWPTIVFYKYYYSLADLSVTDILWCVLVMFALSIVIHYTLEFILVTSTPYGTDRQVESIQTEVQRAEIIANAIRINAEEDRRQAQEANVNYPDKEYFWVPCHRDLEAEKWTNWTVEPQLRCITKSNGKLNVLVMGNSIAYRAFPTIHSLFKGRFNTMRLLAKSTLPGIYSSKYSPVLSAQYEIAMKSLVEQFKPDVIFIIFTTLKVTNEGQEGAELQAPIIDWKTDPVIQHLQTNFDFYSSHSRKIVIDLPYYLTTGIRPTQEINKRLKFGKSLDDLKVTREQVYAQQHWQHERLKHINCTKCILNDIGESLFDGDTFYLYDRKSYLAIISDGIHFSQAGLSRVRKQYGNIVEKVIAELH